MGSTFVDVKARARISFFSWLNNIPVLCVGHILLVCLSADDAWVFLCTLPAVSIDSKNTGGKTAYLGPWLWILLGA